jgi:peptidoglycan hydrolase-like protein with peptidoglycan-binding domain
VEHSDEARGWRGVLVFLLVPVAIVAGLAAMWVVPAVIVSSTATEPTASPQSWYAGDRPGDPSAAPTVPTGPETTESAIPQPDPQSEQGAATGQDETEPVPSDSATASDGTTKTLAQVMTGATVLRTGDNGLPVRFVQQRLTTAGIEVTDDGNFNDDTAAAVERLQEKFQLTQTGRVNRYTLDLLMRITERGPALPVECSQGVVLCIDKTQKVIRVVVDSNVRQVLDARFGALDAATEDGLFDVYDKRADDFSTDFGVPMQYSLYFAGGQAVHFSEFFARDGYSGASAGCVNTRDLEATKQMFDQVPRGAKVFIYR